MIVDLRSDTVTKPTEDMRRRMADAEVGDDVFGEDPTVNALEREVARVLGKEAAMLTPSGTMANQIAIQLHTRPGDSVIAEEGSHCFVFEAGAAAALAGVQFDLVPLAARLADEAVARVFRSDDLHASPSALLVVENTHNRGGGRPLDSSEMSRIGRHGRSLGLAVHCDGARLWNAAAALGVPESQLVQELDTVAVCFSKGLGAPIGSALAGPSDAIGRARKLRKRLGGGMRQAGIAAAAALYALEHHRERLGDDHARAARLAEGLEDLARAGAPLRVEPAAERTNMVYFEIETGDPVEVEGALRSRGVLVIPLGGRMFRAVTHLDIDDDGVSHALAAFRAVLE